MSTNSKELKNLFSIWLGLILICFSSLSFAQETPIAGDQAFQFNFQQNQNTLFLNWGISPGYYLYRDHLKISVDPKSAVTRINYPQGEYKQDINRGKVEIFKNSLSVPVELNPAIANYRVEVNYQGCSEGGFCYPPMHKSIHLGAELASQTSHVPVTSLLTDQQDVQKLFANQNFGLMLLIFLGLGLLLAFTPCVLPMIPILTSIIVGQKGTVSTKKAFMLSSTYVLGSSITYALAGLGAAVLGSSLQVMLQKPIYIVSVSLLFVILAGSLFGLYHLQMPKLFSNLIHHASNKQKSGTYVGVFLMGIISTLIVSPCVTAPLVGVLIYISQTGDKVLGSAALFCLGLGMGIPLILIGMSAGKWLPKSGPWMIAIKEMFGMLMLGMAIWLLARIIPPFVTHTLWTIFATGALIYIIAGLTRSYRIHRRWAYTLGVAAGLVTIALLYHNMQDFFGNKQLSNPNFIVVRSVPELNQALANAQSHSKPALVDFYADWCESCVLMDQKVFDKTDTQIALKNYVLIRADLSANDANEELLMQKYAVVAPPAVLFFDKKGTENNLHRINGEVNSQEFLKRLTTFEMASCKKDKINC